MKSFNLTISSVAALLSISLILGCGGKDSEQPISQQSETSSTSKSGPGIQNEDEGSHTHGAGPHGGTLADWGGGRYHVEFAVDHDKQEATVYVLGDDEKTPEPVKADMLLLSLSKPQLQIDLMPVPLNGESVGESSRFVGIHDSLATVMEFEGTISAAVDGTPYAGNFKEEPHADEGE